MPGLLSLVFFNDTSLSRVIEELRPASTGHLEVYPYGAACLRWIWSARSCGVSSQQRVSAELKQTLTPLSVARRLSSVRCARLVEYGIFCFVV